MFKVNNKDTRTTSIVSIVNFEHVNAGQEQFLDRKKKNFRLNRYQATY